LKDFNHNKNQLKDYLQDFKIHEDVLTKSFLSNFCAFEMDDEYQPRRHQTRLAKSPTSPLNSSTLSNSKLGQDVPMEYVGSNNSIPLERAWTHTSQILRGNQKRKETDQILLDQLSISAEEVRATKVFEKHLFVFRGPLTSYNSVRETHFLMKESRRQKDQSIMEQILKSPLLFMTKIMIAVQTFFRSTKRIVFVTFFDFIVDMVFCLSYLVEVQQNYYNAYRVLDSHEMENIPVPLRVFRTHDLFTVIFACAIWNLVSWVIRMTYVFFCFLIFRRRIGLKHFLHGLHF
jgi:hypothetical protein